MKTGKAIVKNLSILGFFAAGLWIGLDGLKHGGDRYQLIFTAGAWAIAGYILYRSKKGEANT